MILRTLGGLTLEGAGFRRPKPLLLLAYLAVEGPTERRFLAELFWPRAANARRSLTTALTQLRAGAPDAVGLSDVRVWCNVQSDAEQLLRAVEVQAWLHAVELYRGPFLEGLELSREGVELEEWAYATRERLAQAVRTAFLALGEQAASDARFDDAGTWAERARSSSDLAPPEPPDLERLYRLLLASDRPNLGHVRREALALGVDVSSTVAEARSSFRAEASMAASRRLPVRASIFVGRHVELETLGQLLVDERFRLLTLVGPGGIGKTRLALELAHAQSELGTWRGVHFISLETVTHAENIGHAIGDALGLRLLDHQDPVPELHQAIQDSAYLLVLDNFEHLLSGAPLLADLVRTCPKLRLLVTSREALGLSLEYPVRVAGLPVPDEAETTAEDALQWDGVDLFVQRARRVRRSFTLEGAPVAAVLRICRQVGGLPLAIEMAAAWVRAMTCTEIADELGKSLHLLEGHSRDAPERHQSIRIVFEQSWKRLTRDERRVSSDLAVFRGGFSREAATTVSGVSISRLAALVDRALLMWDGSGRYHLHPLQRRWLEDRARLEPERSLGTQERHARYYLARLEALQATFPRKDSARAAVDIESDLSNFLAAWDWAARHWHSDLLEHAIDALGWFFLLRGRANEGRSWSELHLRGNPSALLQSRLLRWQGAFLDALGRREEAMDRVQQSLRLAEQLDATADQAAALRVIGVIGPRRDASDAANAARAWRRALDLYDQLDDVEGKAMMLNNLAILSEDTAQAREMLEHARRIARDAGETHALAMVSGTLVDFLVFCTGDYLGARKAAEESVACHQATGASLFRAHAYVSLGEILVALGDLEDGEAMARRTLAVSGTFHASAECMARGEAYALLGTVERVRGNGPLATDHYQEALRVLESAPREAAATWAMATSMNGLTRIALVGRRSQEARRYAEQAIAHLASCERSHHLEFTTSRLVALTQLGEALLLQGELDAAELQLHAALEYASEQQRIPAILGVLLALAELGAKRGTCDRASDILAMVAAHPASPHELVQRAKKVQLDLAPTALPPQTERIDMTEAVGLVTRRGAGLKP